MTSTSLQPISVLSEFDPEDEYRPEPEPEPQAPTWMDGSLRLGIHTSIAGSYLNALESARKLGANALQIFSASPRMWQGAVTRIPEAEAAAFRAKRIEYGLGPLVIHANYLINLASAQQMLRVRSIQAFHDELVRGVALGADFLVVHPGACGECTMPNAISNVIESVKQACRRNPLGNLTILIENTAGMGTAVGSRLEEVAEIVNGLQDFPVAACLDTAHLFAAGYDIKSEAGLASTIAQIENTIGLDKVPVFHLNDSKIPLGGRVDRHEHLGHGKIGADAFERILKHPRLSSSAPAGLQGRAFILETPIDDPGDDRRNVAALWDLAGLKDVAPEAEKGFSMLTAKLKVKMDAQRKQQASAKKKIANALEARDEDRKPEPKLAAKVASSVVAKKKASAKSQSPRRKSRKKG
ncbi:MAG TPA: deoxyribonuclease IV [Candidatus Dormibacteraeota bacterium]|nr:deoxyribonuclease IV [Candidatus Dormibacteraeota bacterium]